MNDVVNDVCWSPRASTQFALVGGDGRVEIWDVAHSLLDPVVREQPLVEPPPSADAPPPTPSTTIVDSSPSEPPSPISVAARSCLFADNAPVLVVGDILQAVFVGHTLPEIPPPPARGALELVVGTKALPAAILEVVAVPLLPVFAFKAMPAQHIIQYILVRHTLPEITPTLAPVASQP